MAEAPPSNFFWDVFAEKCGRIQSGFGRNVAARGLNPKGPESTPRLPPLKPAGVPPHTPGLCVGVAPGPFPERAGPGSPNAGWRVPVEVTLPPPGNKEARAANAVPREFPSFPNTRNFARTPNLLGPTGVCTPVVTSAIGPVLFQKGARLARPPVYN